MPEYPKIPVVFPVGLITRICAAVILFMTFAGNLSAADSQTEHPILAIHGKFLLKTS